MVGDGKRKMPISAESSVGQFVLPELGMKGLGGDSVLQRMGFY